LKKGSPSRSPSKNFIGYGSSGRYTVILRWFTQDDGMDNEKRFSLGESAREGLSFLKERPSLAYLFLLKERYLAGFLQAGKAAMAF